MEKIRGVWILWVVFSIFGTSCSAQDSSANNKTHVQKATVLSSGFIDILNSGQVNASARIIKLYLGDPAKYRLPISIYSGVSSNNFQQQPTPGTVRSNEHLVSNFINPSSGLLSFYFDNAVSSKRVSLTSLSFALQYGFRVLNGYRVGPATAVTTGKPVNFLNTVFCPGLVFQTGAWERGDTVNIGSCWLALRLIGSYSNPRQLKNIIPDFLGNGFYSGWSIGAGIEINHLLSVKVVCYNYLKAPEINFTLPIYQFSFNYSLQN